MEMMCLAQAHNTTSQVTIKPLTLPSSQTLSQLSYWCNLQNGGYLHHPKFKALVHMFRLIGAIPEKG